MTTSWNGLSWMHLTMIQKMRRKRKSKKKMLLSISNAILLQQCRTFTLLCTYFFYRFIGFVRWACIFSEIRHAVCARDLPWSRAAGTRAWLAEIHFERFTCRAEIACLVRVCREALCLDGNVCHQFSPRRWVVVPQPVRGTARERVISRQPRQNIGHRCMQTIKITYDLRDNTQNV